jgi:hypothetical protein
VGMLIGFIVCVAAFFWSQKTPRLPVSFRTKETQAVNECLNALEFSR